MTMVERIQSKRRRVMRSFRIDELSACDRPAQKHALAVLMKRDSSADEQQEYDDMNFEKIIERPRSFATFEDAMQAIRKAEGCTKLAAMSAAANQHPDLLAKYNAEGTAIAKAAQDAAAPKPISKALLVFQDKVDEIAKRDGIPRYVAMSRARERYADEFEAAYRD
jgi:pterin-4a-carbinolamine dehydratase